MHDQLMTICQCCLKASGGSGHSDWSVTKQEVTRYFPLSLLLWTLVIYIVYYIAHCIMSACEFDGLSIVIFSELVVCAYSAITLCIGPDCSFYEFRTFFGKCVLKNSCSNKIARMLCYNCNHTIVMFLFTELPSRSMTICPLEIP